MSHVLPIFMNPNGSILLFDDSGRAPAYVSSKIAALSRGIVGMTELIVNDFDSEPYSRDGFLSEKVKSYRCFEVYVNSQSGGGRADEAGCLIGQDETGDGTRENPYINLNSVFLSEEIFCFCRNTCCEKIKVIVSGVVDYQITSGYGAREDGSLYTAYGAGPPFHRLDYGDNLIIEASEAIFRFSVAPPTPDDWQQIPFMAFLYGVYLDGFNMQWAVDCTVHYHAQCQVAYRCQRIFYNNCNFDLHLKIFFRENPLGDLHLFGYSGLSYLNRCKCDVMIETEVDGYPKPRVHIMNLVTAANKLELNEKLIAHKRLPGGFMLSGLQATYANEVITTINVTGNGLEMAGSAFGGIYSYQPFTVFTDFFRRASNCKCSCHVDLSLLDDATTCSVRVANEDAGIPASDILDRVESHIEIRVVGKFGYDHTSYLSCVAEGFLASASNYLPKALFNCISRRNITTSPYDERTRTLFSSCSCRGEESAVTLVDCDFDVPFCESTEYHCESIMYNCIA